jgi:alcohol dehydrogenase (cytochrome c)
MASSLLDISPYLCRLRFIGVSIALIICSINFLLQPAWAQSAALAADDWFTVNKDYSSQRYVGLDQITPQNVKNLREICEIQLNEPVYFNSGLLKIGRTLYTTTFRGTYAFDAVTCKLRWRKVINFTRIIAGTSNRGPAYLDGKLFRGTADGRMIAFDAATGKVLWDNPDGADPTKGEAFISAPIAWDGKVFSGIGVSDSGIAGRLMAFDANTGKILWRFNTTLELPNGQPAKAGGGLWATYSLDPATGEVFAGVANPYPDFNRSTDSPGVAAFTNSVISVKAANGLLNWHYQAVPHDDHDWDLATAPTLYRAPNGGASMLAIAGKGGRVYGIDRASRIPVFDIPATTLDNDDVPVGAKWMRVCPGLQGGAMFTGTAYDPRTGALYVGTNDHCAWYVRNKKISDGAGGGGTVVKDWPAAAKLQAPRGWITAIDGSSGSVRWRFHAESQVLAGLVPTKGGLLLGGDTHGNLLVFDAKKGALLKSIDTGGALNSGLISYAVGGTQYVAATVGGVTENPSTVAGPLRVAIYGLHAPAKPAIVTLDRVEPVPSPAGPGQTIPVSTWLYLQNCAQCHGSTGAGTSAPPLARQSQLADPDLLKQFLSSVPPPMPRLYPGVLEAKDVEKIAAFLRTNIFKCGSNAPQRCALPAKPSTGGTQAWQKIYSVLTSPRCLNCHPAASPKLQPVYWNPMKSAPYPQDYPRQGDDRHPHYFTVLRGDTVKFETAEGTGTVLPGMGTPFERCTFCHGRKNDPVTGIPGTTNPHFNPGQPFWFLAPASMAWESAPGVPMTGAQLCASLLDKKLNGNREPKDLLSHITNEPLVKWAFNPGTRPNGKPRTKPPISQSELIQWFNKWIDAGTPCPG